MWDNRQHSWDWTWLAIQLCSLVTPQHALHWSAAKKSAIQTSCCVVAVNSRNTGISISGWFWTWWQLMSLLVPLYFSVSRAECKESNFFFSWDFKTSFCFCKLLKRNRNYKVRQNLERKLDINKAPPHMAYGSRVLRRQVRPAITWKKVQICKSNCFANSSTTNFSFVRFLS